MISCFKQGQILILKSPCNKQYHPEIIYYIPRLARGPRLGTRECRPAAVAAAFRPAAVAAAFDPVRTKGPLEGPAIITYRIEGPRSPREASRRGSGGPNFSASEESQYSDRRIIFPPGNFDQ